MMIKEDVGFTTENYHYIVALITNTGVRNGYIGVPETSPLFDIGYSTQILPDDLSMEILVNVHGGITYSGSFSNYIIGGENYWYFGFDCNHLHDAMVTPQQMIEAVRKSPIPQSQYKDIMDRYSISYKFRVKDPGSSVKSKDYVYDECMHMSNQIKIIEDKILSGIYEIFKEEE